MADNVQINLSKTAGAKVATDGVGGIQHQRVKIEYGGDGTATDVSQINPLPVIQTADAEGGLGLVSTINSTAVPLAGDGVFTGVMEDVSEFASVSVSWNADVSGNLVMQFSTDGTNWDRSIPVASGSNSLQTNHGGVHRLSVITKWFRVVYTNDSTPQTEFRLQTLYHKENSLPLVSRLEQVLNTSTDCSLVRPITNIDLDLARRFITGQRAFFFFGFNNVLPTATWEDIHPSGGDIVWLTTPSKVEVLSTHDDDDSTGAGVRSVEIHGLSATGEDQEEIILMNGTAPVESALTYSRVNLVHNEKVGTYGGSHRGDVTVRVTGGGAVLSVMTGVEGAAGSSVQYGSGEAGNGFVSVPLGKVLYITNLEVFINTKSNQTVDVVLYEREGILNTSGDMDPRRVVWDAIEVTGEITKTFKSHIKIKGLTDLWFRAQASGAGSKISVHLDYYLVDANVNGE
jgi:hypothetical protein